MKLIAALCIYNEEQFIKRVIQNLLDTILDLDHIHILDGAWLHGGNTANSTDQTKNIIQQFIKRYGDKISFHQRVTFFNSQSDKRNHQLDMLDEMYGEESVCFVIDGDEYIPSKPFNLKPLLNTNNIGTINAYADIPATAYMRPKALKTARFFPLNNGFHYQTGKSQCIHDSHCKVIIDYEYEVTIGKTYHIDHFKLINSYNKRDSERYKQKMHYFGFKQMVKVSPCTFTQ